jgi:mannose-6-phosphate isomerase-like protein (cupin superfamily)
MKFMIAIAACAAASMLMAAEMATYTPHAKVEALFAGKGGPIASGPGFSVAANKRTGPGKVEIHEKETDVFRVIDGEATLVTGGKAVGAKQTRPGQTLGDSIEGGTTYHLSAGDVVTVPAGTPHWFKEVPNHIDYYTVKSIKP